MVVDFAQDVGVNDGLFSACTATLMSAESSPLHIYGSGIDISELIANISKTAIPLNTPEGVQVCSITLATLPSGPIRLSLNDIESCPEVDGWATTTTPYTCDWDWTSPSSTFNLTHFNASKPNISVSYTRQDC